MVSPIVKREAPKLHRRLRSLLKLLSIGRFDFFLDFEGVAHD